MKLFCYALAILASMYSVGCKSKQIDVRPMYTYEGVYKHDVPITIDGMKIDRSKDEERVWIISDSTLSYILFDAKHHYYKLTK